jgi:hypothetical protein
MVRRAYAQRSVFEILQPEGAKLWDAELRAMDEIWTMTTSLSWSTPCPAAATR